MKVPMSWFGDYTDMSGISPKEYADALTMSGSKVEGVENLGAEIDNVVTGKVLSVEEHPDSDHLVVCSVDVGDEIIQIVTGAPNVKVSQIVPVAKDKSSLPGGVKIKKGKLRGVESCGMMCSHDELGLTEADLGYEPEYGILVLPENTPVGIDIKSLFGLNEEVVEFEITSNRPDCFSVIGLARETAITFNRPFEVHTPTPVENDENIADTIKVKVENTDKCLRYTAKMVKDIKIGPSPSWLVRRLHASGVRSINNIVDITNYIMLEYGQPMHAFDVRDLTDNTIIVRSATDGEVIKTLDDQDRVLNENDLVIADAKRAVGIAGVMGGFNSEVKADTTAIVFESATFDASSVRLTAQKLGLRTESSARFEKGLDANNTVPAIMRACELVCELGCGTIVGGIIDIEGKKKEQPTIKYRPDKINAFLGIDVSKDKMTEILKRIECSVDEENMTIVPPSFRPDLESEADIAEEIARFYGYDKIPTTVSSGESTKGGKTKLQKVRDKICALLSSQGGYECCTYTFVSPSVFDKLAIAEDSPLRNVVKIINPLGEDTSVMRTTTLCSMMEVLSRNYNQRNAEVTLYEIGKVYIPTEAGQLPNEPEMVTIGRYGEGEDFFSLKGIIEAMLDGLNVKNVEYKRATNSTFHPGRCAELIVDGKSAGVFGEVHPEVTAAYDIDTVCYAAELSLEVIFEGIDDNIKYKKLPKYPAVTRDIAILVDKMTAAADVEASIAKSSGKLLDGIQLFDVYEGKQVPENKKSMAYAISFRAEDRSLTGEEINKVFDKIVKDLEYKLGAQLR